MKNRWSVENIPNLNGRIFIITGGSSGIGLESAKHFALNGGQVVLAVRNIEKGEIAKQYILNNKNNDKVDVMFLDLSDLSTIKPFVEEFSKKYNRLDVLLNNAGVMIPPYSKTKDGFELQMGTNHLGHFALTLDLINILKISEGARVVNVSSNAHKMGKINFEDLNWEKRKYVPWKAYGDSKIANLYFTFELNRKLRNLGINVIGIAVHPGWTQSDLMRHSRMFELMSRFLAMKTEQGAFPLIRGCVDESAMRDDYYGPDGFMEWKGYPVKTKSNSLSQNIKIAEKLWDISEKLTGRKL